MKNKRRRQHYTEPLIPICYRIPVSVEATLTKAAAVTGRTKIALLLEALAVSLPHALSPVREAA